MSDYDLLMTEVNKRIKHLLDRGDALQTRYSALLDASKKLAEALKVAALGETQFDGVDAMHAARQALASYSSFLKEQGVE